MTSRVGRRRRRSSRKEGGSRRNTASAACGVFHSSDARGEEDEAFAHGGRVTCRACGRAGRVRRGAPAGSASRCKPHHDSGAACCRRLPVRGRGRIDVNSVQNNIDWYWVGTYLTPGATMTCSARYEWFTPSGWGLHENNLQCNFDSPSYPQSWEGTRPPTRLTATAATKRVALAASPR